MKTKAIAAVVVAAILVAGAWVVFVRQRESDAAARIPPPPASPSKAIAAHLTAKFDAARAQPTSPDAVGALCVAYHADMFFDQADRCYVLASELDSSQWRWRYYRALIQAERGGGETLVENLRRVVNQASDFGPAWQRLGDALFKAGKYEEARETWERASMARATDDNQQPRHVTEVPLSAYANVGLARIALVQGDTTKAREILERVVAEAPQFSSALRLLADVYRSLGRQAEADRFVYRANRLQPFAPYLDPMVDDLARESRNSTLLLRISSEANLAVNAEWAEYLTRRALEFFQRYHQMVPGDFLGLAHIGSCLSAMGRYQEAESYLRRAVAGIDDPQTHYNLGLLLSITNRPTEAIAEYEKALARDPMHADARLNMATALARQGKTEQASRELTRLVDQDPDNAVARTNLGVVLLQLGKIELARGQLEAALRADPNLEPARQALESITR
jgi:tetratricopeptide (TPR) repeat protein